MMLLIAGLLLFLAIHFVPTRPALRNGMVRSLGEGGYKGLFSIVSLIGLVLIVYGYGQARVASSSVNPQLWVSPTWTRHIAYLLMLPAFILLVAAYVPSRIRDRAKHPMIAAVKVWAFSHLLVRGDLAGVLLFGSLLAWAVYDRISLKHRTDGRGPLGNTPGTARGDVIAIVVGLALYGFMVVIGHAWLIGTPLLRLSFAP